jgi:acetyltransferase
MDQLFNPESIAIIGVSNKPTNLGRNIVLNLMDRGYRGAVYAVGRAGDIVATRRVHRSVLDVPDKVDLAVILTPAASVPGVLEECGQKGIHWAVIETAGFRELGEQGRRIEEEMVRVAAQHGIRFIGPNCVGVINMENGMILPFARFRPLGPAGDISIISQSGGVGMSVINQMAGEGLWLNKFIASVIKLTNPLDLGDVLDLDVYAQLVEQAAHLPGVDGVCLLHTSFEETELEKTRAVIKRLAGLLAACGKPMAIYVATAPEELAYLKRTAELPIFSLIVESISALRFSYERSLQAKTNGHIAAEPAPVVNRDFVRSLIAAARSEGRDLLLHEAIGVLAGYGIPVLPWALATTEAEVREAALRFGRPVALKVISEAISHKTDVGGVRLNLPDADAAATAYRDMMARIASAAPEAKLHGVLVQPMASGGHELIVGGRQDAQFGPVVLVGMGGVFVEVLNEVALRVAPITHGEALAMIEELRAAPILKGARGRRPADLNAAADTLVRVSQLLCDFPDIRELDVNPLLVMPEGAVALDARIIT